MKVGQTISHYRVISKLGEGGMGVVYLAEDIHLGRRVAIKTTKCKPDDYAFLNRFLREARAASILSHQHISTIYDYGKTDDGQPYIVMELVEGKTLSELIRAGALTIPQALTIIRQVAEALSEAHRHGIVHRDIKPSNIAITERGVVKVLDFGLAKQINGDKVDLSDPEQRKILTTQTVEGMIVGTPMYVSPEQALGLAVDERSDLFSLGSVLYECITGQPAFSGSSPNEINARVIRDDPKPPSSLNARITADLDQLTLKSLAKKPEDRYQSTQDLMADILAIRTLREGAPDETQSEPSKGEDTNGSLRQLRGISGVLANAANSRISMRALLIAGLIIGSIVALVWWAPWKQPHQPTPEARRLYERGVEAMREGAFFRATKLFGQVIDRDRQFALAHAALAECWLELDSSDQSKNELIQAQDLVPYPSSLPTVDGLRLQAVTSTVKGNFDKAVESFELLVTKVPANEKAYALVDLGRAYEKKEQLAKAIDAYRQATELDSRYAAAFLRLGILQGRDSQFKEAYISFDRAYSLFDLDTEIEGRVEVLLQRAVLMGQESRLDDARSQLLQALEKLEAVDNRDKRIKVYLNLSNTEIMAGNLDQAEKYSFQALDLARNANLDNLTMQGLIDIGNAYFAAAKFPEAEKKFNEALDLAQRYKGARSQARALLSLSSLRAQQGDMNAARTFFQRALPFYESGGYRKEVLQAYLILSRAEMSAGEFDTAENRLKQLLLSAEQSGDKQSISLANENLGLVFLLRQNFPQALNHFDRADVIARSLNYKIMVGYLAVNRAWALWESGDYSRAQSAIVEAQQIAQPPGKEPNEALLGMAYLTSSRSALSSGDFARAIDYGNQALNVVGTQHKEIAARASFTVGLAEIEQGRTTLGRKHCEEAAKLARDLGDYLLLTDAMLALAEAALRTGDIKAAISNATEASDRSSRVGLHESQWRALAIAALSTQKAKDEARARQLASEASAVLNRLKQEWGEAHFNAYLARPDIEHLRNELMSLV